MLKKTEKDKLKNLFSTYHEVEAVYLFGSAAIGKRNSSSDIDLGIVYNNSSSENDDKDYLHLLKE